MAQATCSTCKNAYGNLGDHNWGDWTTSNGRHIRTCTIDTTHTESGDCNNAPATCLAASACSVCGHEYAAKKDHSYTYTPNGNVLTETCDNGCGHSVTATLTGSDQTYTGAPITTGASVDFSDGWAGEKEYGEITYSNNLNAGAATVTTTVEGKELTTSFAIAPALLDNANIALEYTSIPYDGENHKPAYTVTLDGFGTLEEGRDYKAVYCGVREMQNGVPVKWFGTGVQDCGECIAAGDYSVIIHGGDSGNFVTSGPFSAFAHFVITKAYPTLTAPVAKDLTYNGEAQALIVAGSTDVGEMLYSMEENGTYSTEIPTGTDAGDYTVWYKAVVDESNPNYTSTEPASVKVTIQEAAPTYTAPKAEELTYNSTEQALVTAGTSQQGVFQYALGADAETAPAEGWSEDVPVGKNAGEYFVWYKVTGNTNYADVAPVCVGVEIAKAELTPSISGEVTKVYDGNTKLPEGHGLEIALEGKQGSDNVTASATFFYASPDAGTKSVTAMGIALAGEQAENYSLNATLISAEVGEITRKKIDENAAVEMDALTWNGTEQTAELTDVIQDGLTVTYDLTGNKATDVGQYTMTLTANGNFEGTLELDYIIYPDDDILGDVTTANVNSGDKDTIDKAKEMLESADTSGLPEEQKAALDAALEEISDKVEALEEKLDAAMDAADTEDVNKALAITADKAKASDKQTLQDAKADLEEALTTYATNYTVEEQKLLNDEIDRLEAILADIASAEETVKAVEALPDSVSPDDSKTGAKIDEAQKLYDGLTAGQKQIVDNSTGKKLEKLQEELLDIDKIKGSGRWTKTSGKDLAFVFNGPYDSFEYVEVDGREVNARNYTVSEGSTVITFKNAYLETLSYGKHKLVAVYKIDGQEVRSDADGEVVNIQVLKYATNSATGDMFHVALWAGIALAAAAAAVVLLVLMKKKEKK